MGTALASALSAYAATLRAQANVVDAVVESLSHVATDLVTRWATANDNPLGSPRSFLDAGRRGDFPTCKRGREIAARWVDVDAYIAGRQRERKARPRTIPANANATPAAPVDANARRLAQLAAVGVLSGGGRSKPAALRLQGRL